MRIAIIASPYSFIPPEKYGGSEAMIDGLARVLHSSGHEVELVTIPGSTCPVPSRYIETGEQPHAVSAVCLETSYALSAYEGLAGDFDIVHDHTIVGPAYARAFRNLPLVVTNHGPFHGVLNEIFRKQASWVSRFIAISNSQASAAPVPTTVIHHGTDTTRFVFGNGSGDDGGDYLLFLGRMQWIKGPQIAAQLAQQTGKRLIIAARMQEPEELEFFEKEVEPLLGDGIEFIGEVGGEEKIELIRGASALVNAIQWPEPFGLTMTESLACGTPVIALNRGSVPEIIEDGVTGFICNNEDEMADAIRNIDRIDRRACRASTESYFNIERMAADHVAVYEQVLLEHRAVRR